PARRRDAAHGRLRIRAQRPRRRWHSRESAYHDHVADGGQAPQPREGYRRERVHGQALPGGPAPGPHQAIHARIGAGVRRGRADRLTPMDDTAPYLGARISRRQFLGAAAASGLLLPLDAFSATDQVHDLRGKVTISNRPATWKSEILPGDRIVTGNDGHFVF